MKFFFAIHSCAFSLVQAHEKFSSELNADIAAQANRTHVHNTEPFDKKIMISFETDILKNTEQCAHLKARDGQRNKCVMDALKATIKPKVEEAQKILSKHGIEFRVHAISNQIELREGQHALTPEILNQLANLAEVDTMDFEQSFKLLSTTRQEIHGNKSDDDDGDDDATSDLAPESNSACKNQTAGII